MLNAYSPEFGCAKIIESKSTPRDFAYIGSKENYVSI
jgi:hypothetical protein